MLYSKDQCKQIAQSIANDVRKRWGWNIKVTVKPNGEVSWDGNQKANKGRYDMYPGKTREQADAQVMAEILQIIRRYIPGFQYTSFYQSGKMHYPGR